MKLSKTQSVIALLIVCLAISTGSAVLVNYVWTGTVTIPNPLPHPTFTFTVTANLNGTVVSDPTHVTLPSTFYEGDTYVIAYTVVSTANQGITVTATATPSAGISANWNQNSVSLPLSGNSGAMALTIPSIQTSGSIAVSFTASAI